MRKLLITYTKHIIIEEENEGKARVLCTASGSHMFEDHVRAAMHEPNLAVAIQDPVKHPFPGCPGCGHPMNSHINHEWVGDQIADTYVGACKEDGCHCRYWITAVKEVILP